MHVVNTGCLASEITEFGWNAEHEWASQEYIHEQGGWGPGT